MQYFKKFNEHSSIKPDIYLKSEYNYVGATLHLDQDSYITYGYYYTGESKGREFMEYYSGENYVPTSSKRSSSRYFPPDKIPARYLDKWKEVRKLVMMKYPEFYSNKLVSANTSTGILEKLEINVENFTSPLFYQVKKLSNGYQFIFGLSQDQNIAKQKKTTIDLLNVDEKFVTVLIETVKTYLKDKPQFSNTSQLKDFILKIYKEKK